MPDPFQPTVPRKDEYGRLVTHRQLVAGWPCRWCGAALDEARRGPRRVVLCRNCDPTPRETGAPR